MDWGTDFGPHCPSTTDQPAWVEGLARTLSPAQAAAWEKARTERQATVGKEIDRLLDAQSDQYRESLAQPMASQAGDIIAGLQLPKERAEAITAASKQAVDASLAAWRKGPHGPSSPGTMRPCKRLSRAGGISFPSTTTTRRQRSPCGRTRWPKG